MTRPHPKTYSGETRLPFGYYDLREVNEALKERDAEILRLKRENEALRNKIMER